MNLTFNIRESLDKGGTYYQTDFERGIAQEAGLPMPTWFQAKHELLPLPKPPSFELFENLLFNVSPATGARLTLRTKTTRLECDCAKANRRLCYELCAGLPKTLSVMALVVGDIRILIAFSLRILEMLQMAVDLAATRVRKNGKDHNRLTQHLIALLLAHITSRAGDPQAHYHIPFPNLTWDPVEQCFKALEFSYILEKKELLARWASAQLMHDLIGLGYDIELTDNRYEIAGVSRELIERFSKQLSNIQKAVTAKEAATKVPLSAAGRKFASLSLRIPKVSQTRHVSCGPRAWETNHLCAEP